MIPESLLVSTYVADLLITIGMVVLNLNVIGMLRDDKSHVGVTWGCLYGSAQFLIAYANVSLGAPISAALLVVGGLLWITLGLQGRNGNN